MTISKIYVYFFLLLFPYIGGYLPILGGSYGEIIFLAAFPILLILVVVHRGMPRISKIAVWFSVYHAYIFINGYLQQGFLEISYVVSSVLILAFILVIDNLKYTIRDPTILTNILIVVSIGTFIVSVIQYTYDPLFYTSANTEIDPQIAWHGSDIYRNVSIFAAVDNGWGLEGGTAIGYLTIFFIFLNFYRMQPKYILVTVLLFYSVGVSFYRFVWIMPVIGLFFFIVCKYRKITQFAIFYFAIIFFVCVYIFFIDEISSSPVFQNRFVSSETNGARSASGQLFFKEYFFSKPIWGYGESSWYTDFVARWGYSMGIHVGWIDIIYRGGIVAFLLYVGLIYQIFKMSQAVYKQTGNPVFLVFLATFTVNNLTNLLMHFDYYGYYIMLFYLFMYHQLTVKEPLPEQDQMPEPAPVYRMA